MKLVIQTFPKLNLISEKYLIILMTAYDAYMGLGPDYISDLLTPHEPE